MHIYNYIYLYVCVCALTQYNEFFSSLFLFFFYLYQSIDRLFGYKRHFFFNKTNTQQRKASSSPDIHLLLSIRFYQFSCVNTLTGFTVIAPPVKRSVGKKEDRFVDAAASLPLRTSSLFIHLQINEGTLLSVNDLRPILLKLDARYKRALRCT